MSRWTTFFQCKFLENVAVWSAFCLNCSLYHSIPEIVKLISDYYHIPDVYIYNKTRRKDVVKPRQIVMYILREDFDISYPMIGDRLGGRDHTTVIHSYEKIKGLLKDNPQLSREIEDIRSMLA